MPFYCSAGKEQLELWILTHILARQDQKNELEIPSISIRQFGPVDADGGQGATAPPFKLTIAHCQS